MDREALLEKAKALAAQRVNDQMDMDEKDWVSMEALLRTCGGQ